MANTHSLRVASTTPTSGGKGADSPASTDYDIRTSNERTFEMWIKTNSISNNPGLIERWAGASKNLLIRLESSGIVSAYPGTGGTTLSAGLAQSSTSVSDGAWHHIAVTWNGSVLKMYIDGVLEGTGGSITPGASTDVLGLFGAPVNTGSGTNFDGWGAHVRIWDVERTVTEIFDNMEVSLIGTETNLLHNWKLDNDYTDSVSGGPTLSPVNSPTFDTDVPFAGAGTSAPDPFIIGQWSVADLATGGDARISITALPSDGGDAITDLEYKLDAGAWTSLAGTTIGDYDVSGLTDGVATNVLIRAVNATGNGADSDTKSVTTTTAPSFTVAGSDKVYLLDVSNTTNSPQGEYISVTVDDLKTYINP